MPNTALRFQPADPDLVAQGRSADGRQFSGAAAIWRSAGQNRADAMATNEARRSERRSARGRSVAQIAEALQLNEQQRAAAQTAFDNAMAAMPARGQGGGGDRRGAMRRVREQVIAAIRTDADATAIAGAVPALAVGRVKEVRQQAVVWVLG